jgi:hypothetical protein
MHRSANAWTTLGIAALLLTPAAAFAQRMHRQDFEGGDVRMRLLLAEQNAQAKLDAHSLSGDDPHGGKQCERLVVKLTGGQTCLVAYPFGKTPVIDELSLTAWVKSNRPGVKIAVRVVLPNDKDPDTGNATWLMIEGETSTVVGRWDPIKISRVRDALVKQQGLLQATRKAKVDVRGAYADMLLLNVHTGVGVSDVSVDDLEIGPIVTPSAAVRMDAPTNLAPVNLGEEPVEAPAVKDGVDKRRARTDKGRLLLGDRGFFIRGIRRSASAVGAPLKIVKEYGFNTVFNPWPVEPSAAADAQGLDLQMVPMLDLVQGGADGKAPPRGLDLDVRERERWLAWHVGTNLDAASAPTIKRVAGEIRAKDVERGRPILGHVVEGFASLSRELNVTMVQRFPLGTSLSLPGYGQWMAERRRLAAGLPVLIGGIQTHPQIDATRLAYGHGPEEAYSAPVGPQPAQMELLVCHTLAAGYRGVVMSADWGLSDHAQGFDRMLQAALINRKLALVEPFLAEGQSPEPCRTNNKNVKAVAFPHSRGLLVLAYWTGPTDQFVVGQATVRDVQIVVNGVPDGAQVHLLNLAGAKALARQNGIGGTHVTLPELDACAWIVLTTEANILAKFQEGIHAEQPRTAPLQQELGEACFAKAEELVARLQGEGLKETYLTNARRHLESAREHLDRGREARKNGDHVTTLKQSTVALRTVRAVEELLWRNTAGEMKAPTSDPFATSIYTLPEHLRFQAALKRLKFGDDLLETGDFERDGNLDAVGWQYVPFTTNNLEPSAMLAADARQGRRSLELAALPAKSEGEEQAERPAVVEHTRVAMVSPPVAVKEGQVVRISGFVRIPKSLTGSVDGAMVWDSLGGEGLALRFAVAKDWTPFVLYRPVRKNGKIRVHLVTTGVGAAQFDDLQIQTADAPAPIAGRTLGDPSRLR